MAGGSSTSSDSDISRSINRTIELRGKSLSCSPKGSSIWELKASKPKNKYAIKPTKIGVQIPKLASRLKGKIKQKQ